MSARKAARWPMSTNPLLDENSAEQSAHQLACAIDYWSRLHLPEDQEGNLSEDTEYGGYLLRLVMVNAARTVQQQIKREAEERREREAAKAKEAPAS